MILAPDRLVGREPFSELSVARQVRLVALVEMISIAEAVSTTYPVIDAANAVPEVGRPGDRDSYDGDLDRNAVNVTV